MYFLLVIFINSKSINKIDLFLYYYILIGNVQYGYMILFFIFIELNDFNLYLVLVYFLTIIYIEFIKLI